MSNMNISRILVGGAVAGLIMNVSEAILHAGVLGDDTGLLYQALKQYWRPSPAQLYTGSNRFRSLSSASHLEIDRAQM
jgi:hypothetical protein